MIPLEARKVKDDARRDRNRTGKEKRVDSQTISTFLGREEGAVSLPRLGNWKRLYDDKYGMINMGLTCGAGNGIFPHVF